MTRRSHHLSAVRAALAVAALVGSAFFPVHAGAQDLGALSRDPKQWPMAQHDYANTRYSELDQVNRDNVGQLKVAWTFSLGSDKGQEAAPLVIDGTMYVVSAYPDNVFALDAGTGDLKWIYKPRTDPSSQGVACCDVVNRGLAYDNGKIFLNTLDDHTVALDARSGKELWVAKLGEITKGETMTMAPLVVKGKVLVGNSGGEFGVRGWLTALDETSGKIAWRAYSTGPDKDVLIGDEFQPFYDRFKEKDLGVSSWPTDQWKIGGGTVWGWLQYDPELDLVYYGTGNPGPWNSAQRPGDNLWTATLFARKPETGMARWAHQLNPHDTFDHDEINESLLLDLEIDGKPRKTIVHIGRDGFIWVLDRATGEVISADAYDAMNAYKGVDIATGRIIPNDEKAPVADKTIHEICPPAPGAKDWQPSAWSPRTNLIYVPHQHLCMDWKVGDVGYIAGSPYIGASVDMYAGAGGYRGEYMAWDPVKKQKVWAVQENFPVWSGTLVTAGDVAFYGTLDRWFKAVDAKDGKVLWQFRAGSGIIGQPVTYQGGDGVQYIAVLAGVGGWPGAIANAEIDPRVRNAAAGFAGATQDLPAYTAAGSELLVFALPAREQRTDDGYRPNQRAETRGREP
ncbi:MAG: PQQ-dependent dehydrogenase, methanol/ethanol family [Gemmatimonas sp.]